MENPHPQRRSGWRGYLKEYAIIVIGVLTALAGQQAVEAWQERSRATDARANIRGEIARNLGYMDVRDAAERCMAARLDEIDGLIVAAAAGKLPDGPLWIGQPIQFAMLDGKYKAATQSGDIRLFDEQEQAIYADIYVMFAEYWRASLEELYAWSDLRTLEKHPPASPTLDWQLRSAIQTARTNRWGISLTRQVALNNAARIGVAPQRQNPIKTPPPCVKLNTPRAEALKLIDVPGYKLLWP